MGKKSLIVFGEKLGRVDLENIRTYLDRNDYEECRLILATEPVPVMKEELDKDKRIQLSVSGKPRKEARSLADSLKNEGNDVKLARMEDVSDRSIHRCGC